MFPINEKTYETLTEVLTRERDLKEKSFNIDEQTSKGRTLLLSSSWNGWKWGNKLVTLLS